MIGPALFVAFGAAGCLGLFTGEITDRLGLRPVLLFLFAASAASLLLVAFVPTSWAGAIISAGLQGICVMCLSAVFPSGANVSSQIFLPPALLLS
ncbi:MFS family permease [Pseudorhizobium tarimense]|uniref:MFS family permease n=1 Tax=Pseudorhizobium tarimense TaxID=1079109 RepID=A0ABV2H6R0_9HYPH|nr:hypothetical protein [Pseudorhizobium tarimense]